MPLLEEGGGGKMGIIQFSTKFAYYRDSEQPPPPPHPDKKISFSEVKIILQKLVHKAMKNTKKWQTSEVPNASTLQQKKWGRSDLRAKKVSQLGLQPI